ncbi:ATP-dependent RNA helicase dbp10 [Pestalotiopsis sp. NC0098]|nr:ATP-dependent RNA helicase dbp10 [Pestalotiopsis sp. NC0098]
MPRPRAVSPAQSEAEVDILGSLFTDGADDDKTSFQPSHAKDGFGFDAGGILDDDDGDDADGDEAFIALKQAASFRKNANVKGNSVKKGGGFQAMGLNSNMLRAITKKGFKQPTPIQRKAIPLIMDRKDVVGMARTGSGKTAAFVIPMIERLKAHSPTVGSRALILSPSRELALQTMKVVKEFGRGTDLKTILLVGGDSMEDQFGDIASNPDIIIATPGRFLHLKMEMNLQLSAMRYVVFDEADRLFEMGFAAQLTEILHALPQNRQTLLFSATLPASLVEFARAGLQDPSLVRLDAESKVSPNLQSAFFSVKGAEKEGALLHILQDLIKMPTGLPEGVETEADKNSKKRKRGKDAGSGRGKPTEHSTIVFTATKHHVEYIQSLLNEAGFAVSYVYGSLDQTARLEHVENFRQGRSNILVVTDVAARGIDMPMLANVINYDFPPQPKVFVHRVGRTARNDQKGWSYSLVRESDAPYLIDLQLFLGKQLVLGRAGENSKLTDDVVVGSPMRSKVEANVEWLNKVLLEDVDISTLRQVSVKAEKLYMRTRNSASSQSARRAREVVASKAWVELHPVFGKDIGAMENSRAEMLARISGYRPPETIFESKLVNGNKVANGTAAEVMRSLRQRVTPRNQVKKAKDSKQAEEDSEMEDAEGEAEAEADGFGEEDSEMEDQAAVEYDSDSELEVTVGDNKKSGGADPNSFQDSEVFMSYTPRTINTAEERGYGVHTGGNFVESARDVTMDLTNDDGAKAFGLPTRSKMRWDQKSRRYVARTNDEDGSKGSRMIRGESGAKIAASFQSGRFDKWKKSNRVQLQRVGEQEKIMPNGPGGQAGGARYKHKMNRAPKDADKYRDDYHVRKKRVDEAKENRVGRFRDGAGDKREVKGAEDVRKARQLKQKKLEKNARPMRKK